MRILGITDIHGRKNFSADILKIIGEVDLLLIAGDITNFGGADDAAEIIDEFKQLNGKILAVPGNCDTTGVNQKLIDSGVNLHGETKKINDIVFFGIGGCSRTPFNTPQEYSESDMEKLLEGFQKEKDAAFHIMVTHSPPAKTKVDRTFTGLHVGSNSIRKFIEKYQPDLVLCGHIHEAVGVDKIEETIIINPGPFPKHYVLIDITEKISYKLY